MTPTVGRSLQKNAPQKNWGQGVALCAVPQASTPLHALKIVQNHAARLLVVTDPHDQTVSIDQQLPFIEKLAAAHGQVEQYFVDASGGVDHYFTTPYASLVMHDCLLGESNDQIALDLAKLVEQRLEAAAAKAPGDANEADQ